MARTKNVPGRNDPCSCNSGRKYKYCCIGKRLQERRVPVTSTCEQCGQLHEVDLTQDLFNHFACANLPLHNFCKDEGLFYFGQVTVAEHLEILQALEDGTLTRDRLLAAFKKNLNEEQALSLIEEAASWSPHFERRRQLLKEAVEVHFLGKYAVSIPALFAQLSLIHI